LASIISSYFVRVSDSGKATINAVQGALNLGNWLSIGLSLVASYFLINMCLPAEMSIQVFNAGEYSTTTTTSMNVFFAVLIGMFVGAAISFITEFYTGLGKKPVMGIVQKSATGAATNIIYGLALGYKSTIIPVICIAVTIVVSHSCEGFISPRPL
jgi:K(+)-stimulated pyrophosphate-energized sodium pump